MNVNDRFATYYLEMKDSSYNELTLYTCLSCGALVESDLKEDHHNWHVANEAVQAELKVFIKNVREFMELVKRGVRVQ